MKRWNIGDDILDTRDIEDRIEELEDFEAEYLELFEEYQQDDSTANAAMKALEDCGWSHDERVELNTLRAFKSELENYCDWTGGETLIHKDYQQQYAEDLADDIGAIDRKAAWPLGHIDWAAAAEELFSSDYTEADIQGHTYFARMS